MMLFKYISVALTVLTLLSGCKCGSGSSQSNIPTLAATDTISVPTGLSPEDSIAFIENERFKEGPISVEDLLCLSEIHTLQPYEDAEMTRRDSAALQQMNRFMRMQYVALGEPDNELQWAEAVNRSLDGYCKEFSVDRETALKEMENSVGHYGAGTQHQMNQWCYCMSSLAYYRTIEAYRQLLNDVSDGHLRDLLHEEYRRWVILNQERHTVYVEVQRAGDHYSALPMELEGQYEARVSHRTADLAIERSIIMDGGTYRQQHPVVRSAEWDAYLKNPLWWPVDYDEDSGENESAELILKFKWDVEAWLDARHAVTKALPAAKGVAYDRVTADYHWVIVNEAEEVPEGYEKYDEHPQTTVQEKERRQSFDFWADRNGENF